MPLCFSPEAVWGIIGNLQREDQGRRQRHDLRE